MAPWRPPPSRGRPACRAPETVDSQAGLARDRRRAARPVGTGCRGCAASCVTIWRAGVAGAEHDERLASGPAEGEGRGPRRAGRGKRTTKASTSARNAAMNGHRAGHRTGNCLDDRPRVSIATPSHRGRASRPPRSCRSGSSGGTGRAARPITPCSTTATATVAATPAQFTGASCDVVARQRRHGDGDRPCQRVDGELDHRKGALFNRTVTRGPPVGLLEAGRLVDGSTPVGP